MNGICKIDFEGREVSLLFGMKAARVYQESIFIETAKINESKSEGEEPVTIEDSLNIAFLVYAGMCNHAEFKREQYPSWEQSYEVADFLMRDHDQQSIVWNCFKESKAGSELLEKFTAKEDESPSKKKKKQTGTGSKRTQSVK